MLYLDQLRPIGYVPQHTSLVKQYPKQPALKNLRSDEELWSALEVALTADFRKRENPISL